jgi:hypothetical protein
VPQDDGAAFRLESVDLEDELGFFAQLDVGNDARELRLRGLLRPAEDTPKEPE